MRNDFSCKKFVITKKACIFAHRNRWGNRFRTTSGCGAVRLAHLLWEQGVTSSNLVTPTIKSKREVTKERNSRSASGRCFARSVSGCSAARLARQLRELEVPSSNLGIPTIFPSEPLSNQWLFCFLPRRFSDNPAQITIIFRKDQC